MERVIVVGIDSDERMLIKCFDYLDDEQLQEEVEQYLGNGSDFFVLYEEDLPDLEDALDDAFATKTKSGKLTSEDIKTIRMMMESGDFTQKEVAANYGVCRQTIGKLCKN